MRIRVHSRLTPGLGIAILLCQPGEVRCQGVIGGSTLGFVFDSGRHQLRSVLGMPGAAFIGEALSAEREISGAVISPQQNYALVTSDDRLGLVRLSAVRIPLAIEPVSDRAPDAIALSPTGAAAALFYAADNCAEVLTGLPDAPAVLRRACFSGFAGSLSALAVSDDGAAVLAGLGSADAEAVLAAETGGNARQLLSAHVAAAAFFARGGDAVIADAAGNAIYLLRDVAGAAAVSLLAGAAEGISGPAAVAASEDRRFAVVSNAGAGNVAVIGLSGQGVKLVSCACVPSRLERMSGDSVYRLNEFSGGPLWLFDGDAGEPRIVFVPGRTDE